MNSVASKVLLAIAILQVANCQQPNYIQDGDFLAMKKSSQAFAVFLHDKNSFDDESAVTLSSVILEAIKDSESSMLEFGMINCKVSTISGCTHKRSINHVLLYNERDIVAEFDVDELQTPTQIKALFRHFINFEGIVEINGEEEYSEIQNEFLGKQDVVVFYIPALGTQEHLNMIEHAHTLPDDVVIAYTTNDKLRNQNNIVWYLSCAKSKTGQCEIGASASDFEDEAWGSLSSDLSAITYSQSDPFTFDKTWKQLVKDNVNTILLIAGKGKSNEVNKLAKEFVAISEDTHCLVVDISKNSDYVTNFVNQRVQDNKIFATILAEVPENHIDLGYLESDDVKLLVGLFINALPANKKQEINIKSSDEEEVPEEYTTPTEFQDDPVAFSVYEQKEVRDLYYFDFKTIPRLTDKTYAELMKSNNYSVILFTLELEARAIAVLVDFVEIHKSYEDGLSPMHRVECYHWPDVCKLAGVVSTPRMFFYPSNSDKRIEYHGIWEQTHMRNAIARFSKPLVIFAEKESDITDYLPMKGKAIIGMFETDEVLSTAISDMSEQHYFVIALPAVAEYLSKKWMSNYEDGKLLALENWKLVKESEVLMTKDSVKSFIENAFNKESQVQELTVYNYVSALADERPLLVLFDDEMDIVLARKEIGVLASSEKFSSKISFYWMDSSINTTGEFVLHTYNKESKLEKPVLAFINKKQGSVVLESCSSDKCTEKSVSDWLLACMEGGIKPTYIFNQEPWTPRLEGYDFLEMMKNEGTYPTTKKLSSMKKSEANEDSDIVVKSGRKGNLEMISKKHQKAMENEATETMAKAATDMKKSMHSEL